MTPEEKRTRCAEILGWRWKSPSQGYDFGLVNTSGRVVARWDGKRGKTHYMTPNPLTNASAALELVEFMFTDKWGFSMNRLENQWEAIFVKYSSKFNKAPSLFEAKADTFCEAVTDAFLKASGVEI